MRAKPVDTETSRLTWFLPVLALLGFPAMIDLLQTTGIALLFAAIVFVVFVFNLLLPILKVTHQSSGALVRDWYKWAIVISAIGGLAIVTYLTFVEARGGSVACGPSGGCNTVQHSKYSVLFGVVKVGYLGMVGYIGMLAAWLAWQFGPQGFRKLAALGLWAMAVFGTLFSIYLTSLEPFVIGATCMWCIGSAVLQPIILIASTPAAQQALSPGDEEELEAGMA